MDMSELNCSYHKHIDQRSLWSRVVYKERGKRETVTGDEKEKAPCFLLRSQVQLPTLYF